MHVEDLPPSLQIRQIDLNNTVESARTDEGGVEEVLPIGRCHHDDVRISAKPIHLHQYLVESVVSLVVRAVASASLPAHRVDLVDEDNRRRFLPRSREKVANARCTHSHKNLDEVRARSGNEGHSCLARTCLGQHGLSCAWRTGKKHSLGNPGAQFLVFLRVFEEVNKLHDLHLALVEPRHIRKSHFRIGYHLKPLLFAQKLFIHVGAAFHAASHRGRPREERGDEDDREQIGEQSGKGQFNLIV